MGIDSKMEKYFKNELLSNEKILWSGQPERKVLFSSFDIFLVPFSLLWGGFAFFWETAVLTSGGPPFFMLFGIPFVLIGLYFIAGRFIYKSYRKKKTYYAITNKRVLVLTEFPSRNLQAAFINTIPTINKSIGNDGIGTIKFGNSNFIASLYGNTGMEFFGSFYGQDAPAFYDISNANKVYELVSQLREEQ